MQYMRKGWACLLWIWRLCRPYEWILGLLAAAILASGFLAWYFSPEQNIEAALKAAEPTFLGLAALSVILIWAQQRDENLWKRILSYHQFFSEFPSPQRVDPLIRALQEMGISESPNAYKPFTPEQVQRIMDDKGGADRRRAKTLVLSYLNAYEQFCGAINMGIVDEEYARDMRGSRVIDAYFGFYEFIRRCREDQDREAAARTAEGAAEPFASKLYLELQLVATSWHETRRKQREQRQRLIDAVDRRAEAVRNSIGRGVSGRAKND